MLISADEGALMLCRVGRCVGCVAVAAILLLLFVLRTSLTFRGEFLYTAVAESLETDSICYVNSDWSISIFFILTIKDF